MKGETLGFVPQFKKVETHMQDIRPIEFNFDKSEVAVRSEGSGPGNWVGAPNALVHDGFIYLTYRERRPIGEGRGGATIVKRSPVDDGVNFETLSVIDKTEMDAESLERPALDVTPEGKWRLYLSCATENTKHWRIEVIEADDPSGFDPANRQVVLPGDETVAVKDPVLLRAGNTLHMWPTCHPLFGDPEKDAKDSDQMWSEHWTSEDGLHWTKKGGREIEARPGHWDSRGARIVAVLPGVDGEPAVAYYDGRESGENYVEGGNFEERTGIAFWDKDQKKFVGKGDKPVAQSPNGGHGLRYLSVVDLPNGDKRIYYEATRSDESHDIRTERIPAPLNIAVHAEETAEKPLVSA